MNLLEWHYDFNIKIDKVDSLSKRNFTPAEKDWIFNEAIGLFVKQRYGINNSKKAGFESIQKRTDDLRTLQIKSPSAQQPGVVPVRHQGDVYEFRISDFAYPYWFLTRLTGEAGSGECVKTITIRQVQHDDLSIALEDEFYKPNFTWGEALAVEARSDETSDKKGSIYVYTDNFEIRKIYPEYIKKPNKVWIGTYNSLDGQYTVGQPIVECDLPEHTHSEIVDLAVAECSRIIENPNFAQLKQQKLLTNE
jgi:hypothetical protein